MPASRSGGVFGQRLVAVEKNQAKINSALEELAGRVRCLEERSNVGPSTASSVVGEPPRFFAIVAKPLCAVAEPLLEVPRARPVPKTNHNVGHESRAGCVPRCHPLDIFDGFITVVGPGIV